MYLTFVARFFKRLVRSTLLLTAVFFFLSISTLWAQYSNQWINFSQSYYKIPVAQTGVYRLTYSDLQTAGFPLNVVDPRLLQIYHRGIEQAIFVQGQSDASFDAGDYIEFYGERNDGTRDASLYKPASLQPHTYYNLYSDTSAYFLTWNLLPVQGKRMELFSENNVSNLPKEVAHDEERLLILKDQYSGGETVSDYTQNTFFDKGEGWTGVALQQGQYHDYVLDGLVNGVAGSGSPQFEMLIVGRDQIPHSVEVFVGANSGSLRSLGTYSFSRFETMKINSTLNWTDIGVDGKITVRLSALSAVTNRYQASASYIKITFPQSFNTAGAAQKIFNLQSNAGGKSYVELDNAAAGLRLWDVTDSNNSIMLGTKPVGSSVSAIIKNTTGTRRILASNTPLTTILLPVSFREINPTQHNFIIISNRSLMKPALGYANPVKAYAIHRASVAGGGYDTLTVAIDQLYNQFNYGETSPLAIYEFMKFMVEGGNPKYLFLIGKGRDIYGYSSYQRKSAPIGELRDLVPTAGVPGSDIAFTAGLKGTTYEPAVPTGRITATTPAQVAAYLNKVKEIETASLGASWKKEGIHLSGGISATELTQFRNFLDGYKTTAEGIYWGGNISTLAKKDPGLTKIENFSDYVNQGTNLVTFFGHSSPGTIDIDVGFVTDPALGYNNKGMYPVFLINGCNSGAFFLNGKIFGEDWILAADKGARNVIAHSSFGYSNYLNGYSDLFYKVAFGDSIFIKKGIGDVQKELAKKYFSLYPSNIHTIAQVQQMVLLGDPSVKLFGTSKPDFAVTNDQISLASLDGKPVTALSDSFAVKMIVKNLGAFKQAPLSVRITRTFSNNTSKTFTNQYPAIFNEDTLLFKLYKETVGGGVNRFEILIDPENKIAELNETNNAAQLEILIPSNETRHLFPMDNGIVNSTDVVFKFQDTNVLGDQRDFQFELDTLPTFSSPFLKKQKVAAKVLSKVSLTLVDKDSVVYYWRTKFDKPVVSENSNWTTTSFTIIRNSPTGWAQLQYFQKKDNELTKLVADDMLEEIRYEQNTASILVKTYGSKNPALSTDVSVRIQNAEYNLATQGQPCRNNTINLVAFNKTTLVPYAGIPFTFQDPRTCGREPQVINSFLPSEVATGLGDDLSAYIDNLGVSDSVLLFSIGDAGFTGWSPTVIAKLNELGIGSLQIQNLQAGEPVVIIGRKGAPAGTAAIYKTSTLPGDEQELLVSRTITGRPTSGKIKSKLVGPSTRWIRFVAQAEKKDLADVVSYSIYGVSLNGSESLLQNNVATDLDLSFVDPVTYPFLRIQAEVQDEINLTAAQVKKWLVLFDPSPEGMLVYLGPHARQTVQEGQSWTGSFGFVNISEINFNAQLKVNYDVLNPRVQDKKEKWISGPLPGDTTKFLVEVDTKGKTGLNTLAVFANKKILPEIYYDNNSLSLIDYLQVNADDTDPALDITFDGRYLANGDFVSPNPKIEIKIRDENPFLFKQDTVGITLFLQYPCGNATCPFTRIYLKNPDVSWTSATSAAPFQLNWLPKNLNDGVYRLRVQATDASGNTSGYAPYEIQFQVKNDPSFALNSVYPNPSSDQFRFQFVLTGNELPEDFSLQIFGLDGSIVRKFSNDDVNHFAIGTNELIWDGKSSDGFSLANGIYLYRFQILIAGKKSAQQGKIILLR